MEKWRGAGGAQQEARREEREAIIKNNKKAFPFFFLGFSNVFLQN